MPQLKAAKKDLRKSQRRRIVNDRWRLAVRKTTREVQEAIADKDKKAATAALPKAQAALDRAARRNIIHPNKAARRKSRLLKAISKLK
jgi:small subunit ribosomal protein S20